MGNSAPTQAPPPVPEGTWVRVHLVLLEPRDRAPGLPEDTAALPYEGWVKGFLQHPARIGEMVTIRTPAGRTVTGRLVEVNPGYEHSFGRPSPAMTRIGPTLRTFLEGEF